MKNKILILSSISLILLIGFIQFISADTFGTAFCSPTIQIVNQDPIPAIPNDYVKVVIQVSNIGQCNGFAIKLNPEYPFSLDPGVDSVQSLDKTPFASNFKSTWDIPYKIRIANDAIEGDYALKLLYHEGNSLDFSTNYIVKGLNMSIIDAQTDFSVVIQGTSGSQVSLGIVNTGKNTANSLVVGIPQQDGFRVTGTTEQIVGNLAAGDYTIVTFNIASTFQRNGNFSRTGNNQGSEPTTQQTGQSPQLNQNLKVKIDYTDGIAKRRSIIKNVTLSQSSLGNSTTGSFNRTRTTTSSSGLSYWWYIVIGIIVLIVIIILFIYRENIFRRGHKKNSQNDPAWVTAERTHKK